MVITRIIDFPDGSATSMCILDSDGNYNIYLNSRMSREEQRAGYLHELLHILNHDFDCEDVQQIESRMRA